MESLREVPSPQGLRPLEFGPWDLPRHSIHHSTPSAFPNNVPFLGSGAFYTESGARHSLLLRGIPPSSSGEWGGVKKKMVIACNSTCNSGRAVGMACTQFYFQSKIRIIRKLKSLGTFSWSRPCGGYFQQHQKQIDQICQG